ncbi:hypothetical protein [Sphingomonas sp. TDK1]|uniref:hypothetical protein n=1 Tax=Sphingomonas sp. TDK1 TaxID=453247 RepID=UPI0007D958AD|nr:hypothetical protein [Sphingomonas sp. TDK1]OAN59911.1 hypothetical protein A7X12_02090 [Sphingomonas sp. TDK1]
MRKMDRTSHGDQNCPSGDRRPLFTDIEALALSVGEMDLAKERSRRGHVLSRYFEEPSNALADRRLEALRALVVNVGIARDDATLEAACVEALELGVRQTQIAFVLARHRAWRCESDRHRRSGG